ncbi:MAG: excinuclease ABC subunit C [Actinobacteria bacterium RBG_16_70_17]|nr:MAG: excinuclease ABC subunit C [Actinobacteria bacterium RBG_16_70_17]
MERRPPASEIPDRPGAYLFRDRHGEVLYVGKARSLRKRLAAYFARDLATRTRAMVDAADSVEWIVTDGEVAALMMEYNLIKEHRPRFNIRLRDDKSYPYLAITRGEEWPRATVMRGKRRRDTQYFGPYANAYAIRQTLDLLLRTFPVRTCSDSRFHRAQAEGRPCLLFHIGRCSGPCIGEVSAEDYAAHVGGLAAFLSGDGEEVTARLRGEMLGASEALDYERAARLRDQVVAVERALARQEVATLRKEDFDLFALEEDDLEAALVVLTVRRGRVTGRLATVVDKVEDLPTPGLMGRLLAEVYGEETPPRTVLVQVLPEEPAVWEEWLAARRGGRVTLRVPQRGAKRRLLGTAQANAAEVFARHRLQRHGDHNARARALRSLQDALGLPEPPLRIEAYDISTIQGRDTVGSMVVMEDGLPRRNQYRHFRVRGVAGQDDFAALEEVLRRRLAAYLREQERPVEERGRFAYPPSLLLVDGGAGQVSRAVQVVGALGLAIPVAGLAKRMEEVYLPGGPEPLRIPRGEEALYLLQQVRDEAHRFAVGHHRRLRGRRMVASVLDGVPGVGPARRKVLLRRFGSMARMREAEVEELARVIPARVAAAVHAALHAPTRGAGIDLEEGEGG